VARYRTLKHGDPIPPGEPWRVTTIDGYVLLRWKVGPGEYVECREHRLVAGLPVGKVVHHRNGDPADNRPENLEVLDSSEHSSRHAAVQPRTLNGFGFGTFRGTAQAP